MKTRRSRSKPKLTPEQEQRWKEETLAEIKRVYKEEKELDDPPGEWHSGLAGYASRARSNKRPAFGHRLDCLS